MKRLFTNDVFFFAAVAIALIGGLFYVVVESILWPQVLAEWFFRFMSIVCLLTVFVSYKRHSKNVMKGMIGALLMAEIAFSVTVMSTAQYSVDKMFGIISFILMLVLFINHFIINSDHLANPLNVVANQVVTALLALCYVLWCVLRLPTAVNLPEKLSILSFAIAFPCVVASIVCIESRLDAYRLDREDAGWTQAAGYPKDYIHAYDKND